MPKVDTVCQADIAFFQEDMNDVGRREEVGRSEMNKLARAIEETFRV
jgi:hypothetical protein